jgi:alpha-galactosidase
VTERRRTLVGAFALSFALSFALVGCPSGAADDDDDAPEVRPVPVYLLAGQSNMEGYGPLMDADLGGWPMTASLEAAVAAGDEEAGILDAREDVWVTSDSDAAVHEPGLLEPGFGAGTSFLGPELGMGHALGDAWDEPVVFYKSAKGGSTLGGDWRPPSAGGSVGASYTRMVEGFSDFLADEVGATFPDALADRGEEIAGFVWLQGWNDQFEDGFVAEYEDNLVALVEDVRDALGVADLPVVVVEGPTLDEPLRQARLSAIARLDADRPGRQVHVATEDLVEEEVEGNFHFHFNAANYLEVGRRAAVAMADLREGAD